MNALKRIGFLLVFILGCTGAAAQCATGVNTGGGNCVPPDALGMPGYYEQGVSNAAPMPVWQDRYGAIVIDDGTGDVGVASAQSSKSAAEKSARKDCEAHGARDCRVALSYHNQCAALAWGKGIRGTANNPSENEARSDALKSCEEGATDCKVIYSACSNPVRVQ